ncbi:MAG: hypothetical protein GXP26_17950 [Planctomycetes bacterium]|nr:hypothetical protein [Planctomycetota bacterium]
MRSAIRFIPLLILICLPAFVQAEDALDRNSVYRVNPPARQLRTVPQGEIKLGFVYKYFNPRLSRHVWGIAIEGGKFRYAFGPGSMQPADRFDLRISDRLRQQIIEENAPALSRGIEGLGRDVFVQLDANDQWQLYLSTSIPKVFDLMTNRRWEWHGNRRVGVLHTQGPLWTWQEGHYLPMTVIYLTQSENNQPRIIRIARIFRA